MSIAAGSRVRPYDDAIIRFELVWDRPSAMLFLGRFDEPLDRAALEQVHRNLLRGPLNRVVKKTRTPGARDRWVAPAAQPELAFQTDPIPESGVHGWFEEQGKAPLDLRRGPTWRLSATAVEGGGSALALLVNHAVTDGAGVVEAWVAAAAGVTAEVREAPGEGLMADLLDSLRQWRAVLCSSARSIRWMAGELRKRGQQPSDPGRSVMTNRDLRPGPVPLSEFSPSVVLVRFSAQDFRAAAERRGGTANTLLIAVAVRLLVATGVVPEGRSVKVGQQIVGAATRDDFGNYNSEVCVDVAADRSLYENLRPLREANKSVFADRSNSGAEFESSVLVQMVPDWLFALFGKIAEKSNPSLCSVSNMGRVPSSFLAVGNARARAVYGHVVTQKPKSADYWRSSCGQIQIALIETGQAVCLSVEGRNPEHHGLGQEGFAELVVAELQRWGLRPARAS